MRYEVGVTRLPSRPDLEWKPDGTPVARAFDDVYFSLSDGLEETRNVFLKACGLPERWAETRVFSVAELGFGSGLNFLALLECWLASEKRPDAWLHFVSVEKFLMSSEDASRVLKKWPGLSPLTEVLVARWPKLTAGLQRIEFPEFRVSLTIYIGDVTAWLATHDFKADAWFLDGFAPAKNDDMWSDEIYQLMAQRSAKGCLVGTYTVAGAVRRGLASAGFEVSKQPGFGRKRERLEACWPGDESLEADRDIFQSTAKPIAFANVCVIGAGIAGASIARQFAEAGYPVEVLDRADGPASGASGNPFGLVMPRLDAADTAHARLLIHSYFYALDFYQLFAGDAIDRVDVRQLPTSEREQTRFQKLLDDPPISEEWFGRGEGEAPVLLHKRSLLIQPARIVSGLLDHPLISVSFGRNISSVTELSSSKNNLTLFVISSGWESSGMLPEAELPLTGKLGQVELGDLKDCNTEEISARAAGTYALRHSGQMLFGATFEAIDRGALPATTDEARKTNMEALRALASDWANDLNQETLLSRASVRATTPDRFPVVGRSFDASVASEVLFPLSRGAAVTEDVPHHSNIYVLTGLGARGFTFAPLMASLIRAMALNEPLPLARPELEAVSPIRFLVRAVRKGVV